MGKQRASTTGMLGSNIACYAVFPKLSPRGLAARVGSTDTLKTYHISERAGRAHTVAPSALKSGIDGCLLPNHPILTNVYRPSIHITTLEIGLAFVLACDRCPT